MAYSLTAETARKRLEYKFKVIPTDEYLEKCFQIFKRFLKENGAYIFIFAHIFPDSRPKEDFLKHARRLYTEYSLNFGDILHMCNTLGDYCRKDKDRNSPVYWERNIKQISDMWKTYFSINQPEINDGDFMDGESPF